METIQNILVDCLNGFPTNQIPLFLFQLFCAALAAQLLQLILNKKVGDKILHYSALLAVGIAFLASIVKYSEPMAILAAAIIVLLLGGKNKSKLELIATVLVVSIGVGCGVGSVVQTALGVIVIFAIILFTPLQKK